MLSLLFLPRGGPNSIANFDGGGAMAGFAPSWIRHCTYIHTCMYYIHTHTSVHTYIVIHFDIFVSLRKRSI